MKKILFVAGHSGGHIIPCATQAKNEKLKVDCKIYFITTDNLLDKKIINNFDFIDKVFYLSIFNIPKNPIKFLKFILYFTFSFIKSLFYLYKIKPNKVVSMGGLITIPVFFAAKILKINIELWELNVEPGKTIIFLSKFCNQINICFDETKKFFRTKKCNLVTYPIRFNESSKQLPKNLILNQINFSSEKKTILIIGGSQGSQYINNLFKEFILKNLIFCSKIQMIHQTGSSDFDWISFYKSQNIKAITFNFYEKMEDYYRIADLVICRSGAGTLAEVQFFEKKCITIPLTTKSTSHQVLNAINIANKNPETFKIYNQEQDFQIFEIQIMNLINLS